MMKITLWKSKCIVGLCINTIACKYGFRTWRIKFSETGLIKQEREGSA